MYICHKENVSLLGFSCRMRISLSTWIHSHYKNVHLLLKVLCAGCEFNLLSKIFDKTRVDWLIQRVGLHNIPIDWYIRENTGVSCTRYESDALSAPDTNTKVEKG